MGTDRNKTIAVLAVLLALAALAAALFLFKSETPTRTGSPSVSAAIVPFEPLANGSISTVHERVNYLITSSAQLHDLWSLLHASGPVPQVDFSKEEVIAAFAGEEPTTGYGIRIATIKDATKRTVILTLTRPGVRCVTGQMVTAPYEVVKLPKTSLPLTHVDTLVTKDCAP